MKILYSLCLTSLLGTSLAQAGTAIPPKAFNGLADSTRQQSVSDNSPLVRSAGIHFGTQGIGLSAFMPVRGQFGVHAGVTLLPVGGNFVAAFGNYDTRSDASVRFTNLHVIADWAPFLASGKVWKHLTLNAGAGYFFKAGGDLYSVLNESYYYGDIEIKPEDVGTMNTTVEWKETVTPYLGVALHSLELSEQFALGVKLGSYLLSKPSVNIATTGLLEGNENLAGQIEENISDYRFLPVLQINFNYKF